MVSTSQLTSYLLRCSIPIANFTPSTVIEKMKWMPPTTSFFNTSSLRGRVVLGGLGLLLTGLILFIFYRLRKKETPSSHSAVQGIDFSSSTTLRKSIGTKNYPTLRWFQAVENDGPIVVEPSRVRSPTMSGIDDNGRHFVVFKVTISEKTGRVQNVPKVLTFYEGETKKTKKSWQLVEKKLLDRENLDGSLVGDCALAVNPRLRQIFTYLINGRAFYNLSETHVICPWKDQTKVTFSPSSEDAYENKRYRK